MTFGAVLAAWLAVSAVTRGAEAPASLGVGASFETLQVGKISYQHVEVRSIGARSLMISHAGGLASVRLRDLSPELQAAFGYKPEDEAALNAAEAAQKSGKDPAPKSGPSATKRPPVASTLDRLGQSFGQPPEIRPTVDLRPRFLELGLNVKNQGPRPSCAVFALVSVLEYQNAQLSGRGERFSEEYLIWATCKTLHQSTGALPPVGGADAESPENLDVDAGFTLPEVVVALRAYGVPLQSSLPYSFSSSMAADPSPAVIDEARNHRRVSVFALPGRDQPTLLANLIQALDFGVPVVVGLQWPTARAIRTGYLSAQNPLAGKTHAVAIVGYENKTGQIADTVFIFKSSWGVKWGAGGFGYVTYGYLNLNLGATAFLEVAAGDPPAAAR